VYVQFYLTEYGEVVAMQLVVGHLHLAKHFDLDWLLEVMVWFR
jgi:hypothetical protein